MDAEVTWPEEKRCTHCKHLKKASEFSRDNSRGDGLQRWCRTCRSAYRKVYNARPEVRAHSRTADRTGLLRRKYGMSPEDYDQMLATQAGRCAICRRSPRKGENLCVDHDHSCCPPGGRTCGRCVRGLLCHQCNNKILGYWLHEGTKGTEQALATARRLVAYLEGGQDDRNERAD